MTHGSVALPRERCAALAARTWLPLVALVILGAIRLFWNLAVDPAFWFDEGYKTNAARTIAEHGVYATLTADGYIPFDPGISGGPADILAIALSFKLFGVSVFAARVPAAVYGVAAIVLLYGLAAQLHGRRAGVLAVLAILAAPTLDGSNFVALGRQALAEMPALAWLAGGVLVLAKAWQRGDGKHEWIAGVLLGIGVLSRQQWAMALVPAILAAMLWRARPRTPGWTRRMLLNVWPLAAMTAVVAAWKIVEFAGTPAAVRIENAFMAAEAVRSNLITASFGRMLSTQGWMAVVVMLLGAIAGVIHLARLRKSGDAQSAQASMHVLLAAFVFGHCAWYALLSVGWPRYAFPGMVFGLLLLAANLQRTAGNRLVFASYTAMLLLAAATLAPLIARAPLQDSSAANMATLIQTATPPSARIETWEWEIATLAGPERFHLPHQNYLFQAIRQRTASEYRFTLSYDALQRNPDYLLMGKFASWTGIYDQELLSSCFTPIASEGSYTLYQRIDCPSHPL